MPAEPIRTCIACRRKATKAEFLRLGAGPDGSITLTNEGRGAYVCKSETCIHKAFGRKLFKRPLRLDSEREGCAPARPAVRKDSDPPDWDELERQLLERLSVESMPARGRAG